MKLEEQTKRSIARIVTELINADGIVDETEIDNLYEFKKNYQLNVSHFIDAKAISLADAINNVINSDKNSTDREGIALKFCEDLKKLANIDGSVVSNEAMICLAFRYALEYPNSHVFSYRHPKLRFSKKRLYI